MSDNGKKRSMFVTAAIDILLVNWGLCGNEGSNWSVPYSPLSLTCITWTDVGSYLTLEMIIMFGHMIN